MATEPKSNIMGDQGPVVHLIPALSPLLSGAIDECQSPDDPTCYGGIASTSALARAYSNGEPFLLFPGLDKNSAFVQMHPLGWAVNRYVLHYLIGANAFGSSPALLLQNKDDFGVSQRDISDLQSKQLPLLLTNVDVPVGNSWNQYTTPIYFDKSTGLALIHIFNSGQPLNSPQIDTTLGALDYIARANNEAGCNGEYNNLFHNYANVTKSNNPCWIPVILFADVESKFNLLLEAVLAHDNPPALFLDLEENSPPINEPRIVGNGIWLLSIEQKDDEYHHQVITLNDERTGIQSVDLIYHALNLTLVEVPETVRDEQYNSTIEALSALAQEAAVNDPVVAQSKFMPPMRDGTLRRCKAGACEVGSLFLDAMRWWTGADIAFGNSGGFRGSGWDEGPIKISNIWDSLPFPNNLCSGVMTGVSVFKAFNHSVALATFEYENTDLGDRLLQVSGMRLVYNTKLEGSRLVSMDVWDEVAQDYLPVERLKLYSFTTDSFMCSAFDIYGQLLTDGLVFEGEEAGVIDPTILVQEVVAEYLSKLDEIYVPTKTGRMFNATTATEVLNLVQTADSCAEEEFWSTSEFTCISCPTEPGVLFLKDIVDFEAEFGSSESAETQTISFVNTLTYTVTVVSRSTPFWLSVQDPDRPSVASGNLEWDVKGGETKTINLNPNVDDLAPGTAQGSVIFGVLDGQQYPGCSRPDATFRVSARVDPPEELNQLGSVRYVGWGLAAVVICSALYMISWVMVNRKERIVKILQPAFLIMISIGVMVMGTAMIPLGIDDEIASDDACSAACMAFPWLLSIGFTIAMSALFSKLWRINRLFSNSAFGRLIVREQDVMGPFYLLFTVNFVSLLTWTLAGPLEWERSPVNGEAWNTVGKCSASNRTVSLVCGLIVGIVNISVFTIACFQAFQARDIGDEFSESKNLGVALFSWVQLFLIGVPVFFLIDEDNPSAKYFISIGLVFAVSMSMLLLVNVPLIIQKNSSRGHRSTRASTIITHGGRTMVAGQTQNSRISRRGSNDVNHKPRVPPQAHPQHHQSAESDISHGTQTCNTMNSAPIAYGGFVDLKKFSAELRSIALIESTADPIPEGTEEEERGSFVRSHENIPHIEAIQEELDEDDTEQGSTKGDSAQSSVTGSRENFHDEAAAPPQNEELLQLAKLGEMKTEDVPEDEDEFEAAR